MVGGESEPSPQEELNGNFGLKKVPCSRNKSRQTDTWLTVRHFPSYVYTQTSCRETFFGFSNKAEKRQHPCMLLAAKGS